MARPAPPACRSARPAGRAPRPEADLDRSGQAQGRRRPRRTAERRRRGDSLPARRRSARGRVADHEPGRTRGRRLDGLSGRRRLGLRLPEMRPDHGRRSRGSKRVSNPGCYPTGFVALAAPLVRRPAARRLADHGQRRLWLFRRRQVDDRRVRGAADRRQCPHLRPWPRAQTRAGDAAARRLYPSAAVRSRWSAATPRACWSRFRCSSGPCRVNRHRSTCTAPWLRPTRRAVRRGRLAGRSCGPERDWTPRA
jgi:hypothetical protein